MGTGDYGLEAGQKDRETKGTDGVKKSFSFPGVWFVFLAGSDARILTCLANRSSVAYIETTFSFLRHISNKASES